MPVVTFFVLVIAFLTGAGACEDDDADAFGLGLGLGLGFMSSKISSTKACDTNGGGAGLNSCDAGNAFCSIICVSFFFLVSVFS